jgi:hypothetical protein
MAVISEVIISLLKVSKGKRISRELVKKDICLPSAIMGGLLQRLQRDGLLYVDGEFVEIGALQRLKLAVRALELGADYERVSGFLSWREFEGIAAVALETHGYTVGTNLRFRQGRSASNSPKSRHRKSSATT